MPEETPKPNQVKKEHRFSVRVFTSDPNMTEEQFNHIVHGSILDMELRLNDGVIGVHGCNKLRWHIFTSE